MQSERSMEVDSGYRYFRGNELPLRPDVPGSRFFEVALDRSMLSYFELDPGTVFPSHHHDSEQITLVLSGNLVFEVAGREIAVGAGEAIAIASRVDHAVRSLDQVVAVDAWAPPRAGLGIPSREPGRPSKAISDPPFTIQGFGGSTLPLIALR